MNSAFGVRRVLRALNFLPYGTAKTPFIHLEPQIIDQLASQTNFIVLLFECQRKQIYQGSIAKEEVQEFTIHYTLSGQPFDPKPTHRGTKPAKKDLIAMRSPISQMSSSTPIHPTTTRKKRRRTLLSLPQLLTISAIACIPFSHVYSFQSTVMMPHARNTGRPTIRKTGNDRYSSFVSPLKESDPKSHLNSKSKWSVRWEMMFDLLSKYKEREGNTNVPEKHKEEGLNLGLWLTRQRQSYKAGKLLPERQSKLESLGVQLKVQFSWEEMFDLLCKYKERGGNTNVPQKHKEEGLNLGMWLCKQCQSYKAGKLLPERQSKLESLGVQLKDQSTAKWEEMFDLLCTYKEREGNTNVTQKHKEEGLNLGLWLCTQRQSYKAGKLLPERQSKLESLGVQLKDQSTTKWEEMFDLLCTYKEREGNTNVTQKHKEEGLNLGLWLCTQRQSYKAGKLLPERQSKLESLGVQLKVQSISTASWEEMFDLLCTYKEREGNTNVPQKHKEEGLNLGLWLTRQRQSYKAGKLLPERQSKLESLGVQLKVQSRSTTSWEEMFDLLCTYKEREGNTNVPQKHKEEGLNLGLWLRTQRASYKAGKLLPERQSKLESLVVRW